MSTESLRRYKEQRDRLKEYFEAEKETDQTLFTDQAKLLKPLLDSQKESSRHIADKITTNSDTLTHALTPLRNAIENAIYQRAIEDAPQPQHSTPTKDVINVNLDTDLLNDTNRENLQDMQLDLPSEVQKKGNIEETLDRIEKHNRKIGQFLRADSKKGDAEKQIYRSQQETLKIYKQSIEAIDRAQKFVQKTGEGLVRERRGRGRPRKHPPRVVYSNGDELCVKLNELIKARNAGNNDFDNTIKAILEELLTKHLITKDDHNKLLQNIF